MPNLADDSRLIEAVAGCLMPPNQTLVTIDRSSAIPEKRLEIRQPFLDAKLRSAATGNVLQHFQRTAIVHDGIISRIHRRRGIADLHQRLRGALAVRHAAGVVQVMCDFRGVWYQPPLSSRTIASAIRRCSRWRR